MRRLAAGLLILMMIPLGPVRAEDSKTEAAKALERRQKVEIMGFFLKDPDKAQVPQTTLAIGLFNQAVEHFQAQEYELARNLAKESLQYDDQNSLAYELIGEIDYREQKMADAKQNFEIAYNLQPRPELKKKIEKVRNETTVERKLSTTRERHFIIKYHNQDRNIEQFDLRELLRSTYRNISQEFGYYFRDDQQIVILLYDYEDFKKLTKLPHWVAGVYDGKVRMPINREGFDDTELDSLTAHEVTHAFIAAMSAQRAPAWINEGLAQYMESKIRPIDLTVFNAAVRKDQLLPIDLLMDQKAVMSMQDPIKISLFYQQSYELVKYMVDRYGVYRLKKILEEMAKGKNSDEAVRKLLRISPTRLEEEWLRTLK